MKKHSAFILITFLLFPAVVFFSNCQQVVYPEIVDVIYEIKTHATEHGEVIAVPDRGIEGTEIKIVVNPEPNYKLKSLQFHHLGVSNISGANVTNITQNPQAIYSFDMHKGGSWITAEFAPLGSSEYSVSLQTGEHGKIIVTPTSGPKGTKVRVYNYIDLGYSFRQGYPQLQGASWTAGKNGYEFIIDEENVTLVCEFEKPDNIADILQSAYNAMSAEEYDTAFSYYEIAYQAQKTNEEAIFYSTLGKLFSIGTNAKVRELVKKIGMNRVPGTINDWLNLNTTQSTNWLADYRDGNNTVYKLPRLEPPSGNMFPGSFLNYDIYQKNTGKRMLFDVLLFWNLVGNNPAGFNEFLDDILKYVFGSQFEEVCERAEQFPQHKLLQINPALKTKFNLDTLYGVGVTEVGRDELDVLVSFLRSIKALAELAASYDWEMDLTLLRVEVGNSDTVNALLNKILNKTVKDRIEKSGNYTILPRFLPLRSHLLKNRSSEMASSSRNDFSIAVNQLDKSIDAFYNRFDATAKTKYAWLIGNSGFVKQLKTALDSGGTGGDFYIPQIPQYKTIFYAMEGESVWVSPSSAQHGINLGNLFRPGYLTADKLVTTESGGKVPVFFGFKGAGGGTAIADGAEIAVFDTFSMEFDRNFKDVFVKIKGKTAAEYRWVSDIFPDVFTQSDDAMDRIYAKNNVSTLYEHYLRR